MRKRIYDIIEPAKNGCTLSHAYDLIMMCTIIASIVPLAFKTTKALFLWLDYITVTIFIADYLLRLLTADFKLQKAGASFLLYPFTPMAIIDLLSILPSILTMRSLSRLIAFDGLLQTFRLLRLFRLLRTFKVLRAFKILRYSRSYEIIANVFKKQRRVLGAVAAMAIAYIILSALVIFNVEPESFATFFDALYWATISLTTIGYGDIYPVTAMGKFITMVSSVLGVAIIALPSGVITAGYLAELNSDKEEK